MIPTKEQAFALLKKYNTDPFHLRHAQIVSGVMEYFARELGYGEQAGYWGIVGLLHDLDFEQFPEQHCIKSQQLMREAGLDESIIRATASHGYGITVDIVPEHMMEKVLYAADELTGLIGAAALMRPSRSVQDMELKSVKKKYKNAGFAAGCWAGASMSSSRAPSLPCERCRQPILPGRPRISAGWRTAVPERRRRAAR